MANSDESSELKTYHGNCHCGLFRFHLNVAPLTTVWTCNCSICTRNGYLWIHPVAETQFVIDAGKEKALHSYQFAMRGTTHLFCPECGSSIMARRRESLTDLSLRINARMLDDLNLDGVEIKSFSGAEMGPKYEPQHGLNETLNEKETTPGVGAGTVAQITEQKKKYKGNCHCGNFKFTLTIPELKSVQTCNCSVCVRKAYMWIYPLEDADVQIERGEGILSTYLFGGKDMIHMFCPTCGTAVMGKRKSLPGRGTGINARTLQEINLKELEKKPFPGSDLMPEFHHSATYPPPPSSPPLTSLASNDEDGGKDGVEKKNKDDEKADDTDLKIYNGSCHCSAVSFTVKTKSLEETEVMSCNCSLCSRNGDIYIYPPKTAVSLSGTENLTPYAFLSKESLHCFCKICGVSVLVQVLEEGEDVMPLNVRNFKDVDLERLRFRFYDGWSQGREYSVR